MKFCNIEFGTMGFGNMKFGNMEFLNIGSDWTVGRKNDRYWVCRDTVN